MQHYRSPIDAIRFNLEAFGYTELVQSLPAFSDFDLETAVGIVEEYARFCEGELLPLSEQGDRVGVRFDPEDASVHTPEGWPAAWRGYAESGWTGLTHASEHGGIGAPYTLGVITSEILIATNKSFSMCPGLTNGLIDALTAHGSEALKARFLPPLISGAWTGTMCLTEPHAGTDLGLLATRATPDGDSYTLTGTKIWISFGEHDLTENIVHLVLARLPDAPAGIKGISVFVVPKFLEDGTRNAIHCGGLEHKMGISASPTCVMNLEGARGWLVGEPHRGMRTMFVMMNAARLNTGIEGLGLGEYAYQAALAFARDRRQSRSLAQSKRDNEHAADCILVHPDVRRMLLTVKSTTAGLRGLATYIATQIDIQHHHPDAAARQQAGDLVALLTPIMKSYGSERGFLNTSEAMQVMGGAGYTQDWPVEQAMRDLRIAMIYEGTNHIQALDLVGRKLVLGGGRLLETFLGQIGAVRSDDPRIAPYITQLAQRTAQLVQVTGAMMRQASTDPELIGAVASSYLNLFALVTLGYVHCRQLVHALTLDDDTALRSRLQTARFYFEIMMPEVDLYAARVAAGKGAVVELDVELL